jgi:AcrR family transcriptional regulator
MPQRFPIRTQRKAETRKRLIRAAQELFALQGYGATTLEAVAERAGLHVQTLYRHFQNKVELAAAGGEAQLERFRDAIRDASRTDTTLHFWRRWLERATNAMMADDGGRSFREALHDRWDPSVASRLVQIDQQYEDLLAESLERDLDLEDSEERGDTARLIAIALMGANNHVLRRHAEQEGFDLERESVAMVDRIEQLFAHVLGADQS